MGVLFQTIFVRVVQANLHLPNAKGSMAGIRLVCKVLGSSRFWLFLIKYCVPHTQVSSMIVHSPGQTGSGGSIQEDSGGYEAGKTPQCPW